MPKLRVFIERENKNIDVEAMDIKDLMKKLNLNPETVLISRNNELITDDINLEDNDEIKFLSVISGG
nr:MoaD/ThiS family protein [Candidatus Woesearchaeota archaeon]